MLPSAAGRQMNVLGQPSLQPHPESRAYPLSNGVEGQFNPLGSKTSTYAAGSDSAAAGATVGRYGGSLPGATSTGKVPQPRMAPKQSYPPLTIPDAQPVASGSGTSGRRVESTFEAKPTLPPVSSDTARTNASDGFPNERRLFHAYIYDYLYRQGYQQAARAFLADLPTTAVVRTSNDVASAVMASGRASMNGKGKKRSREDDEIMESDEDVGGRTDQSTGNASGQMESTDRAKRGDQNVQKQNSQETSVVPAKGRKRKSQEGGGTIGANLAGDTSDSMMDMMLLFSDGSPTSPASSTASASDLQNNLVISDSLNKAAPGTSNSDQSSNGSSANSKDSDANTASTAATGASVHMGSAPSRQSSFIFNSDTSKLTSLSSPPPFGSLSAEKGDILASPQNDSPNPLSASSSKATVKNVSTLQSNDILPKPDVQIAAPQGFLFEWWTIFWDIYRSKHDLQPSTIAAQVFMQASESGTVSSPASAVRYTHLNIVCSCQRQMVRCSARRRSPCMGNPLPLNMYQYNKVHILLVSHSKQRATAQHICSRQAFGNYLFDNNQKMQVWLCRASGPFHRVLVGPSLCSCLRALKSSSRKEVHSWPCRLKR